MMKRVERLPWRPMPVVGLVLVVAVASVATAAVGSASVDTKAARASAPGATRELVFTGEAQAVEAQVLYVPQANMSPVVIRYYLPEGRRVKRGEVILRIDAGQSASQIRALDAQIEQARAKMDKEVAELQVKALDAELSTVDAEAALASARIDAAIPRALVSGLDHDRWQGELDRATRELALKRRELEAARGAGERRRVDGALEVRKLQVQRDYHAAQVALAEVVADRDGVVRHAYNNNWIGGRIDEGSSAMPGSKAGEVVSGGRMSVRAWVFEPDRRGLTVGQPVVMAFDALPGRKASGRITAIAGAPDQKREWGEGRWYQVDVDLAADHGLALLPGMSVRVTATVAGGA